LADGLVSSREAYRVGLVNKVVPKDKLFQIAEEMAQKIASFHPTAVRNAKQAVTRGLDLSLAEGLDLEKRLASELTLISDRRNRLSFSENE
jgi:enoyl-CoA hydratase/carnithine racemase